MSQRDTYSVDYLRRQQDLLSTYSPRVGPAAPSQSQEDQYRVLQLMDSARFKYPEDYLRTSGSEQSRIGALAGNTSDQLYARTMSPGRREGLPSLNSDTNRPIDPYASLSPSARGAIASPSVASPSTSQQIDPYLRAALSPASGRSDDYLRASLTRGQIDDLRAPLSPSARIDDLRPPLASRLEESLRSPILHNTLGSAKLDDSYRVPLSPAARLDDPALHRDTRAEDIAALRSPIHSSPRNALDDQRYASRLPETRNPVEDVLRSGITPASASTAAQPQRSLESYYAQLSSNRNDYLSTLSPRRLENVGHAFDPVSPALRSRTEEYLTRLQAESHSESRPAPPASALAPLPSRLESSAAAIHATPAATLEDPGLYHREPVPPPTTNSTAATAGTTRHDERSGTPTQSNEWVYKTIWLGSGDALKPQGLPPGVRIVISVSFEGDNLKPHDALVRAGVQCHKFQWDKPGDQVEGIELIHRLVSAEIPLLVHSTLGKSYAAALVVSYLVACVGMSYDGAVSTLVAGSPVCQPNIHLEVQLRNFENHFRRIKSEITKIDVLTGRASPQRSEVTQVPSLRPKAQPARKQSQPTAQRCRSPPTKRGGRGPTKSTMEK